MTDPLNLTEALRLISEQVFEDLAVAAKQAALSLDEVGKKVQPKANLSPDPSLELARQWHETRPRALAVDGEPL